jgi:hypothetical protein
LGRDQERDAAGFGGHCKNAHARPGRDRALQALTRTFDDRVEAGGVRTTEEPLRARAEVANRASTQSAQRVRIAGHHAACLFLEEGEPKLVS